MRAAWQGQNRRGSSRRGQRERRRNAAGGVCAASDRPERPQTPGRRQQQRRRTATAPLAGEPALRAAQAGMRQPGAGDTAHGGGIEGGPPRAAASRPAAPPAPPWPAPHSRTPQRRTPCSSWWRRPAGRQARARALRPMPTTSSGPRHCTGLRIQPASSAACAHFAPCARQRGAPHSRGTYTGVGPTSGRPTCGWKSPPSRMRPGPAKILVRMAVSFSYFS